MATKWDIVRDEWLDLVEANYLAANEATRGHLLNNEHRDEFLRKYGAWYESLGLFSDMSSTAAYRYASDELVDYWRSHPRLTWSEYAVSRGIYYAHVVRAARRAPGARQAAENRRASTGHRRYGFAA